MDGFVPFPEQRAAGYRAAGYWTERTVPSLLSDAARRWPANPAVTDAADTLTYAELDAAADRAAAGLQQLGIAPGERVLLQLPNSVRFAVALFALLRAGAVPVLCLPAHRSAEIGHLATVSGATAWLIPDAALAAALGEDHPALRHVIDEASWKQITATALRPVAPDPADPALLLISGGTTGPPKLIPRTHTDYVYNATASAQLCRLTADDTYLAILPAAHNFPLACPGLLGAISVGAHTVFSTDPSPEAAFAVIAQHRVTVTALVPALATLWAQACAWEPQRPTSLRLLQVGGAKLAAGDARRVREALTPGLQQVFGMAEGLLCYTRPGDPPELVEQTQGRPLCPDDELVVLDSGELLVRGPYTINGYFNAPEVNAGSFTADGFYRTGDRVRLLPNGYLEVTGRLKDVIHRGGETVPADMIETHLLEHPDIRAVAVVGIPDGYLGERICAAVVCDAAPTLARLNEHLQARGVATHTRVDQLLVLPALPTTAVGKVDKKAVARRAAAD